MELSWSWKCRPNKGQSEISSRQSWSHLGKNLSSFLLPCTFAQHVLHQVNEVSLTPHSSYFIPLFVVIHRLFFFFFFLIYLAVMLQLNLFIWACLCSSLAGIYCYWVEEDGVCSPCCWEAHRFPPLLVFALHFHPKIGFMLGNITLVVHVTYWK